jgi:hypothetical protein
LVRESTIQCNEEIVSHHQARPTGLDAFQHLPTAGRWMLTPDLHREVPMKTLRRVIHEHGNAYRQKGAMGYVLAWLLGVPIPILIIVALLRGCS